MIEIEGSSSLRIYQVPVPKLFRPDKAPFRYPSYARDWGVEQDFSKFLQSSQFLTNDLHEATHLFLPIFWTRYWLQNNCAKDGHGPLNEFLNSLELDESKVFTICQYADGPLVDFHFGKGMYLSSRQTPDAGRDIPLLATSLPRYGLKKERRSI